MLKKDAPDAVHAADVLAVLGAAVSATDADVLATITTFFQLCFLLSHCVLSAVEKKLFSAAAVVL